MDNGSGSTRKALFAVLIVLAIWAFSTWLFWVGYTGTDDLFYTRYAHFFHRPPMLWWEFRIVPVLAIRASFAVFGISEFAAALPNLTLSLLFLLTVGWMIGWPRHNTWYKQAGMMLAAFIPLDAAFRSWPGATNFAGILFCLGMALLIGPLEHPSERQTPAWRRYAGAFLMALAFTSHEVMFFPVAIACLVVLFFDWRRFWKPVLATMIFAGMFVATEAIVYSRLLGDPLARFHVASVGAAVSTPGIDLDVGISGWRFYTWPIELLLYLKPFAGALFVLLVTGIACWKHLNQAQRILFATTFFVWFWFGWGSTVPFAYHPLFRQAHYYGPLMLGVATLLPFTVPQLFKRRAVFAKVIFAALFGLYFVMNAAGGHWGQNVVATRALLDYANHHSDRTFVTDVNTMNQMYMLGGFTLPRNVFCLPGPAVEHHLLLNRETPARPRFQFPAVEPTGILVNLEHQFPIEPELVDFSVQHPGMKESVLAMQTKWFFKPFSRFLGTRPFMIRNRGAEAILLPKFVKP